MPAVYLALEWMHLRCLRMVAPPASHGSRTTEPAGGPRGRQEGCVRERDVSVETKVGVIQDHEPGNVGTCRSWKNQETDSPTPSRGNTALLTPGV